MPSLSKLPILIAGGGPVGMITALALARQGLAVHVFEADSKVNESPRAATTHAATLEMLEELGLVDEVIGRGLVEPLFRNWDRTTGKLVAEFDFGVLKDDTRYPFAVQCEQHKLAKMAVERLPLFPMRGSNSPHASSRCRNQPMPSRLRSRRRTGATRSKAPI